jgi:hypothetical protein
LFCTNKKRIKQKKRGDRIAQWISASDFGSEGRGFDSHCGRLLLFFFLSLINLVRWIVVDWTVQMLSAAAACGLDTGETHRGRVEYSPTTRPAAARHLAVSLSAASTRRHMASAAAAADPGAAYKLLLSCPAGLPRSRVSVKFDQSFDRIPHPDAALEESISVV